ncbi:MAG: AAA-like domain-containing protein [Bacteroidia bacterium]
MKRFNTSGPNLSEEHYTISRTSYLEQGVDLVLQRRYFTIWAPRQTGKSTYFRQLALILQTQGYEVAHINFENYKTTSLQIFVQTLKEELAHFWDIDFNEKQELASIFRVIQAEKTKKYVLIIDEIEGVNPEYLGDFLHSIRNAYHSRTEHSLKSVILVGVTNIVGVIQDNASPFNIAENLNLPYFTEKETFELLEMHEQETGQLFEQKVKQKIYDITAGQPGLVNGFANQLVTRYSTEKELNYQQYLVVENWYLTEGVDKNISNIINKAKQFRPLVELMLFKEVKIPFEIYREAIKVLYANGLLKKGAGGFTEFWVPLYKKCLHTAFYPYTNGEGQRIGESVNSRLYFTENGKLKIEVLIEKFKEYVNRRGFGVFREKTGELDEHKQPIYKSIPEAAMIYAFETYIQAVLQELEGKSYREANTALGKTDLLVTVGNEDLLIESKVFSGASAYKKGKNQLAYYCKHLGLERGIYLVFVAEHLMKIHEETIYEAIENIEGVEIYTYIVLYEEDLPEYRKPATRRNVKKK